MLLLHVSDIHLKEPGCLTPEDPELHFRDVMVAHAAKQAEKHGDVHALLVSGDIAFKGHQDEYAAATQWFEHLAASVGCNKRRIYMVPGNHDVDRSVFAKVGGARNAARAISSAGNNDARERELDTQLDLKDSAADMFASINAYNLFASKYDCASYPGRLRWHHELRLDESTVVAMHGLNSTLVSGIDENDAAPGKLYMGARQLNAAQAPGAVNLLMAHHPPEWMSDQDEVEMRLLGAPNMVLFGHKHIQRVNRNQDGAIMFSAGSVNPERHEKGWVPAYNLIQLDVVAGERRRPVEIIVRQFEWQSHPNGFRPKINILTDEPFFKHTIDVEGVNRADDHAEVAEPERGDVMQQDYEKPADGPSFSAPSIRDLIYRFWDLPPRRRKQILLGLQVDLPDDPGLNETKIYREALVEISRNNRLAELEAAIAEQEAAQ